MFILNSSFSCPGPSTWLLPGPIVSGRRAIRSVLGENKGAPRPHFLTTTQLGLQVLNPALGQINTTAHKRHPSKSLRSEGWEGWAGHSSRGILLKMPKGPSLGSGAATPPALAFLGPGAHPEQVLFCFCYSLSRGPPYCSCLPPLLKPTPRPPQSQLTLLPLYTDSLCSFWQESQDLCQVKSCPLAQFVNEQGSEAPHWRPLDNWPLAQGGLRCT